MDEPAPATVLVVDDEPTLLQLLTRVLGRAGYRVLACDDGDAVVDVFEKSETPVRALVIDYLLRPRGAVAIVPELLARAPGLGVVVTSGSSLDADGRELLESCGGRFVRKPFAPEALLRAVEAVLDPGS